MRDTSTYCIQNSLVWVDGEALDNAICEEMVKRVLPALRQSMEESRERILAQCGKSDSLLARDTLGDGLMMALIDCLTMGTVYEPTQCLHVNQLSDEYIRQWFYRDGGTHG